MTIKRIFAIIGILLLATIGWGILGTATAVRSGEANNLLRDKVYSLCGDPLTQKCPNFYEKIPGCSRRRQITPSKNKIEVNLFLEQRRKGLLWFPVYRCDFSGSYSITNNEPSPQRVVAHYDFPSSGATYDSFLAAIDGKPVKCDIDTNNGIDLLLTIPAGETRTFSVKYVSRGVATWKYLPQSGGSSRVENLEMKVKTDFAAIDFPDNSLSPMNIDKSSDSSLLTWQADSLITKSSIGIIMPQKLNPGPLVTRVTYFAPVCLIFFFVALMAAAVLGKISIHPMHYLFVAAGFFAFHLLFAYLVDIVNVHAAFLISSLVTLGLVNMYLRGTLGAKFAWKSVCAAQFLYLILFSYSFFLKGMTGLTITIGSIITLSVLMFLTRKIDWNDYFSRSRSDIPIPPIPQTAMGPQGATTIIGVNNDGNHTDS